MLDRDERSEDVINRAAAEALDEALQRIECRGLRLLLPSGLLGPSGESHEVAEGAKDGRRPVTACRALGKRTFAAFAVRRKAARQRITSSARSRIECGMVRSTAFKSREVRPFNQARN